MPKYPDKIIKAGRCLCQAIIEPIQDALGRVSNKTGHVYPTVNAQGRENKNQYNCSRNNSNHVDHLWECRDKHGQFGATASIVVNLLVDYSKKGRLRGPNLAASYQYTGILVTFFLSQA